VTFIYADVGLAERRFFAEGLPGESAVLAQTARRWTRLRTRPGLAPDSPPPSPPGGSPLRQAGGSQPGARHHDR
jgi:hypothetical protein